MDPFPVFGAGPGTVPKANSALLSGSWLVIFGGTPFGWF